MIGNPVNRHGATPTEAGALPASPASVRLTTVVCAARKLAAVRAAAMVRTRRVDFARPRWANPGLDTVRFKPSPDRCGQSITGYARYRDGRGAAHERDEPKERARCLWERDQITRRGRKRRSAVEAPAGSRGPCGLSSA